jgi:LCP family protein required for cell wall assembly
MQQVDINVDELDVNENLSGYRNIALFGVDSRDSSLGKGNRSDCIIIASINEKTKDIKLLSVYRDSYVQIEGYGLDKITHAYSYGEAPLAIKTLNTNLDLNITEFVTVNFDVVAEAVNALGGVEITIEQSELQYINAYIDGTSDNTGISSSHITTAGKQTLDGVQAVAYSRIRYTSGGDYKRTERMRDVIEAMLKKLKTKSVGEINSLMNTILPKVYTNISSSSIIAMIPDLLSYNITESLGWPYNVQGITLDRWYGVPVTLESNVKKLHQELFGEEDYEVPDKIKEISNKIINKTGYTE